MTQRYDPQARRKSKRQGRERGCWIYIPLAELERAGFAGDQPPPFYRVQSFRKGTALVNLFGTERPPARQSAGGGAGSWGGAEAAASVTAAAERAD